MDTQKSPFNRILLIVLISLYVLSIAAFVYANRSDDLDPTPVWMLLLNLLILSIPLGLVYGSTYVLVTAWRQHRATGQISPRLAKFIHWAPKAAAMLIIFFVSLFSLDVFSMGGSVLEKLGGFLIHNIPSIGMIVVLVLAWRRPRIGFFAFLAVAAFFAVFFVRGLESLPNLLIFVLPLLLVAILFYGDWKWVSEPPA